MFGKGDPLPKRLAQFGCEYDGQGPITLLNEHSSW